MARHGSSGSTVNSLATNFAVRAIEAQPVDYLKVVWRATLDAFQLQGSYTSAWYSERQYQFPAAAPQPLRALAAKNGESYQYGARFNGGADPSTRLVQPFASLARRYQRLAVVPGPLLAAIVLMGLLGMAAAWRRFGGAALLPWLAGAVLIVTPAATADYDARYVVAAVPVFCIAAAIGMQEISLRRSARRKLTMVDPGMLAR